VSRIRISYEYDHTLTHSDSDLMETIRGQDITDNIQ